MVSAARSCWPPLTQVTGHDTYGAPGVSQQKDAALALTLDMTDCGRAQGRRWVGAEVRSAECSTNADERLDLVPDAPKL